MISNTIRMETSLWQFIIISIKIYIKPNSIHLTLPNYPSSITTLNSFSNSIKSHLLAIIQIASSSSLPFISHNHYQNQTPLIVCPNQKVNHRNHPKTHYSTHHSPNNQTSHKSNNRSSPIKSTTNHTHTKCPKILPIKRNP